MRTLLLSSLLLLTAAACSKPAEFTLTAGDDMKYDVTALTAKPGQDVKITLVNKGKSPVMKHNVVVTKPGAESDVATKALEAGEAAGYVPKLDTVIAATPLADPGKTVTVSFKAPSTPGDYPFLCTYPGHAATMRGTLSVKE